ncbi:hypothetical protein KIPB_013555, partial [Kipferlia bialata]
SRPMSQSASPADSKASVSAPKQSSLVDLADLVGTASTAPVPQKQVTSPTDGIDIDVGYAAAMLGMDVAPQAQSEKAKPKALDLDDFFN